MYLNLIQVAESFGVSEKVVEDWIRADGLPHTPDRGRLLFDQTQVAEWAAARGLAARVGFLAPQTHAVASGLRIEPLLRAGGIWRDVPVAEVPAIYERVVAALPGASPAVRQVLGQRLRAPGGVTLAPVGAGFALPHFSTRVALGRESGTVALLLLRAAWPSADPLPDDTPVTNLFFFIAPSPRAHLDVLGRICWLIAHGLVRESIRQRAPDDEILRAVAAAEMPAAAPEPAP
jgi:PTS system nitrogen regulatory IIA component